MAKKKQPGQSVQELLQGIDLSEQEALALSERRQNELLQLRKRIKAGETTGDHIRDFVIACHGYSDTALVARYRTIEEDLARYCGQFVLLVSKSEEFHGCTGFDHQPHPNELSLDVHLFMGVIEVGALLLDLEKETCAIPVCGEHICAWHPSDGKATEIATDIENRSSCNFVEAHLKPLKCKNPMHQLDTHFEMELRIGDKAVAEWFTDTNERLYGKAYKNMAVMLGRPLATDEPDQPTPDELVGRIGEILLLRQKGIFPLRPSVLAPSIIVKRNVAKQIKPLLALALQLKLEDKSVISIRELCEIFGVKAP